MPEPEAELQATANLSPVSPSPVHTAAPLVVPALQDTVDTIDAMVAAAVASEPDHGISQEEEQQQQPHVSETPVDPKMTPAGDTHDNVDDEDINDDDSFGDPYSTVEHAQTTEAAPVEQPPDSDDYAKTFDSPVNPEEDDVMGDDEPQPREQTSVHFQAQETNPSDAPAISSAPYSPTNNDSARASTQDQTDISPAGKIAETLPTPDLKPQNEAQNTAEETEPNQQTRASSADIQQLVADLSAQSNEEDTKSSASTANESAAASHPPTVALPTSASLPPRPPQPNEASPTFPSQHHPGGSHTSTVQTPTFSAPGDALSGYTPGASPVAQTFPGQSVDRHSEDYQRQWNQFVADERQYMSEAKWDRFPEGSRIFIGSRTTSSKTKHHAHIFSAGNLSSDKVSKRDVFDIFYQFGRLAQISLKSAYGFVQYHTVEEGRRAIDSMEGSEVKGRRIREFLIVLQTSSSWHANCA